MDHILPATYSNSGQIRELLGHTSVVLTLEPYSLIISTTQKYLALVQAQAKTTALLLHENQL